MTNFKNNAIPLSVTNPELVREWDYEKNTSFLPNDITADSKKKVWWKCSKGHEWNSYVCDRSRGVGCPYCNNKRILKGYNDLSTTNPELAKEWNYEKNYDCTPDNVCAGSGKKVWWKDELGHEWEARSDPKNE